MKVYCEICGKRYETSEIGAEQRKFYGESICKVCWLEHPFTVKSLPLVRE